MYAAYREVCRIGESRGIDVTGEGVYRRVSLTPLEMDVVVQMVHPSSTMNGILARFKAKNRTKRYHAYYCVPKPPPPPPGSPSESSPPASDPVPAPLSVPSSCASAVVEAGEGGTVKVNSIGWHSDPYAGALLQVFGTKQLEIGGIHVVPEGSAGQTVPFNELPSDALVKRVTLPPNSIVGFGARQIHHLNCNHDEENLSISVIIDKL